MARFSACSQCNKRTRKIVRDKITRKNKYLCPKCNKEKDERQQQEEERKELQRVQQEAEKVKLNTKKEEPELPTPQMLLIDVSKPGPDPAPISVSKPVPRNELQQKEEENKQLQRVQQEAENVKLDTKKEDSNLRTPQKPLIDVPKPVSDSKPEPSPVTGPKSVAIFAPAAALQTPPIMEIVTIKGRKYMAISATASEI